MSRSYKKIGVLKDGGHWVKKHASRKFRSRNNQLIRMSVLHQDFDELQLFEMDELVNQYDFCDWKSFWKGEIYYRNQMWGGRSCRLWTDDEIVKLKRDYFNK